MGTINEELVKPDLKREQQETNLEQQQQQKQQPFVELKAAFKAARKSRDREMIEVAKDTAERFVSSGHLLGNKEAHIVISVYKMADRWRGTYLERASSVLNDLIVKGGVPDTMIFNNVIDMFAKCKNGGSDGYVRALEHLARMKELGVEPDLLTYTSVITSCSRLGRWKESISILEEVSAKHGLKPDKVMYTAVIKVCSDSGRWQETIRLLAKMKRENVRMDSTVCNSVITACAAAGQWEAALKVISFMRLEGLEVDHYTYSAIISACDKGGQSEKIGEIYNELLEELQSMLTTGAKLDRYAATLNTIITHHSRAGNSATAGIGVYKKMIELGIPRNEISYTTLVTSLAKERKYGAVLDVFAQGRAERYDERYLVSNSAVTGSVVHAAGKEKAWDVVVYVLELYMSVHRDKIVAGGSGMRDATDLFNLALAVSCRSIPSETNMRIAQMMKSENIAMDDNTYTYMILACKNDSLWEEALDILSGWKGNSKKVYSACISVLVESKKWIEALDILDEMEGNGVTPSEVTYNSAIEALDASNELIRAELVFRSALRMDGVYNMWLHVNPQSVDLDLHRLPVAVARAAVRHTLGEMSTGRLSVADLVVITGRGNHQASRFSTNTTRGLMKASMRDFLLRMELEVEALENNPGRIIVRKASLEAWFAAQERDDAEKRKSGSAHGNLFLSVARAKKWKPGDFRAVCPFSSATEVVAPDLSPPAEQSVSKCPAHAQAPVVAEAAGLPAPRCPAHAHAQAPTEPTIASVEAPTMCPGHDSQTQAPTEPSIEVPMTAPKCPAHAHRPTQ